MVPASASCCSHSTAGIVSAILWLRCFSCDGYGRSPTFVPVAPPFLHLGSLTPGTFFFHHPFSGDRKSSHSSLRSSPGCRPLPIVILFHVLDSGLNSPWLVLFPLLLKALWGFVCFAWLFLLCFWGRNQPQTPSPHSLVECLKRIRLLFNKKVSPTHE